jgi:hypothetical protein
MEVSTLSGLIAALLAAAAPSAAVKQQPASVVRIAPPAPVLVLRDPSSTADRRTRTCNARGSQRQSNRVERNLAPVACEQPPRSKVILTFEGGLFGSGH